MDLSRALRQFDASIGREIGRNARVRLGLGPMPTPGVPITAAPMSRIGALSRLGGSILYRATLPTALYNQAREVFNPRDNIVTSLQNLGVSINNLSKPLSQRDLIPNVNRPFIEEYNRRIIASRKPRGQAPTDAELAAQGFGFGPREYDPFQRPQTNRAPTDAELSKQGYGFGVREYDPLERRILPAGTVLTGSRFSGLTPSGEVDRTQSDTYKQYAQTPAGQFERYFKTPEMDQYFGAASRGTAAPKDVEAMQALAGKTVAPGKTPEELSAFYRAESAMGRAQMPQIQQALQDKYGKETKLSAWAAANPMLAQRLYVKMQGGRPLAPDQETVMGDLGSRAQDPRGYTPKAFGMPDNPASPIEQPVGDQENRSTGDKVQSFLKAINYYGI